MDRESHLQRNRGTSLSLALLAAALLALLALPPVAAAATDPVTGGSTVVTFDRSFVRGLQKQGVRMLRLAPAKASGRRATFPVTVGEVDPTSGAGLLAHGGGLRFKAGRKSAAVRGLVLDTAKRTLVARIAGRRVKLARVGGLGFGRAGFGVAASIRKVKLTKAAAKMLNRRLAPRGVRPFVGDRLIAVAETEAQPGTVTLLPEGGASLVADSATLAKLAKVKVQVKPIGTTTVTSVVPPVFGFPATGGAIAPDARVGLLQSAAGIELVQKLETTPGTFLESQATLSDFWVDLSDRTVLVDVTLRSNATGDLNRGPLGRGSIADLDLDGATVFADGSARTVTLSGASATLQPVAAEVLDAFVRVYESYERNNGGEKVSPEHIVGGTPLGTLSFGVQTQ
jgi:hypothetical protein